MPKQLKNKPENTPRICACCGVEIPHSDLGLWADIILKRKPACSLECNIKLGQIKKTFVVDEK